MLTNFVGDISGNTYNTMPQQHSHYYQQQQQQQLYYLNNKILNESNRTPPQQQQQQSNQYASSFARRELLLDELKQHQQQIVMQQQQQQHYDYDEDDLVDDRLVYKRRSITSSPVRYNFNSKSSPPVIMRIDSAKTAKLNRLRSYEKQTESNYTNSNNDQVNTPSTAWPNNNLR